MSVAANLGDCRWLQNGCQYSCCAWNGSAKSLPRTGTLFPKISKDLTLCKNRWINIYTTFMHDNDMYKNICQTLNWIMNRYSLSAWYVQLCLKHEEVQFSWKMKKKLILEILVIWPSPKSKYPFFKILDFLLKLV